MFFDPMNQGPRISNPKRLAFGALGAAAVTPPALPREFRAARVATVDNIDWPSKPLQPVGTLNPGINQASKRNRRRPRYKNPGITPPPEIRLGASSYIQPNVGARQRGVAPLADTLRRKFGREPLPDPIISRGAPAGRGLRNMSGARMMRFAGAGLAGIGAINRFGRSYEALQNGNLGGALANSAFGAGLAFAAYDMGIARGALSQHLYRGARGVLAKNARNMPFGRAAINFFKRGI